MQVSPITTRIFKENEDLVSFIKEHIGEIKEKSILLITSKIVALGQGRTIPKNEISKKNLVAKEADYVLGETYQSYLTIKDGILIPAAGIDESNSENGDYILWPKNSYEVASHLWHDLKRHYHVKNFGIVLTDSRCTPLRQGVTGVGLAHWGFKGIQNHIGKKDLFGRKLTVSTTNLVDCLATAATLVMGESSECTPLCLVADLPFIEFQDVTSKEELLIAPEKDIFKPLFKNTEVFN